MGSREDKTPLLIDTMVNGSAVNYNAHVSRTSVQHGNTQEVSNVQSEITVKGEQVED